MHGEKVKGSPQYPGPTRIQDRILHRQDIGLIYICAKNILYEITDVRKHVISHTENIK